MANRKNTKRKKTIYKPLQEN